MFSMTYFLPYVFERFDAFGDLLQATIDLACERRKRNGDDQRD